MRIQVYAKGSSGALTPLFDSSAGVELYNGEFSNGLLGLEYSAGVGISGTATIRTAPGQAAHYTLHELQRLFPLYRTEILIYKDDVLLFRGRTIASSEDFYKCITYTCEGERGFFLDSVIRPYLYQDSPANVFSEIIAAHNSQVDDFKQFQVGTVTVTDANDYVRLESEAAESTNAVLSKLIERCGGYLEFTTNTEGQRVVSWYASIGYQTNQTIEFGQNLTDYVKEEGTNQPITVLYPYGAKDETGARITVKSVNGGLEWIQDNDALAVRGYIAEAVYWDDVTLPSNLLAKAQVYLESRKNIITSLQLQAVDLSALDTSLDAFRPADKVRVISAPHGIDEYFTLMEKTEDLLNPSAGSITLGKEKQSLTGLGVAGDKQNADSLQQITGDLREEITSGLAGSVAYTEKVMSSLIEKSESHILSKVSEDYITNDQLSESLSTSMNQTSEKFEFKFNTLKTTVDENDANARKHIEEQEKYIRFIDGKVILGTSEANSMTLTLENGLISFKKNGQQFGWWDGDYFHTGNIHIDVSEQARLGNFAFTPRANGSLTFGKIGG